MLSRTRLCHTASVATAALALAFLIVLLAAVPAFGASVPLSIDAMSRGARAVVVADCISTVSRAVNPSVGPRSGIVTDVTLSISDAITGTSGNTVTITQPGGEVDGIGLVVTEVPTFTRGGRYVVFLGANGQVFGAAQGALALAGDRVGSSREPLSSLKRRVRAATGTSMTLAETLAETVVARAGDAAAAVISPLATPAISAMSPSDVSAGTGDAVTISGTGFGAMAGSVAFYCDSETVVLASVDSWSDTSITCEVPVNASSGAVAVTNGSGLTSAGFSYDVGFSFGGSRWAPGTLSETYRINPNCADATTAEVPLIDAAAATWSAVSNFTFGNGGMCASTVNPTPGTDGHNDIYWASSGFTSSNILAWNRYWYYSGPSYNTLVESDIVFNDAWSWNNGTSGTFDIQSVAVHELGHSFCLGDQYGPGDASESKIMYGMIPAGTQRRTLTQDDIAGVRWIYGFSGDATPPEMGAVTSSTHPSDVTWYPNHDVTFSWNATDTGAVTYSYALDHTSGTRPDTTPQGAATTCTFSGLADGEWYLHVSACDESGNWSDPQERRVRVDVTAPSGTFTLNGGSAETNTTTVTVDSAVTGATQMRIAPDGTTYGSWIAYAAQRTISIAEAEGTATVAVQYRDLALNTLTTERTIVYNPAMRAFSWVEIAGSDRYATALAVSRAAFAAGSCDTVIISTGANYPDALGAGGLAGAAKCPILLVKPTGGLSSYVRSEIVRLTQGHTTRKVYITGSTVVVSAQTEADLKALVGSANVKRLGGKDRYATANLIARQVKTVLSAKGTPYSGKAFVTTGQDFPDALLASPVAYGGARPILLVGRSGADAALRDTITALGVTELDIVGSTTSVPTAVQTALAGMSGITVRRVASATDKYSMTVAFTRWAVAEEGFSFANVGVATGATFPDAVAAGPLQGSSKSLVVLTPPTYLDSRIRTLLQANYDDAAHVRFLGSTAAVTQPARNAVIAVLK